MMLAIWPPTLQRNVRNRLIPVFGVFRVYLSFDETEKILWKSEISATDVRASVAIWDKQT
jgi:hypothetical protein